MQMLLWIIATSIAGVLIYRYLRAAKTTPAVVTIAPEKPIEKKPETLPVPVDIELILAYSEHHKWQCETNPSPSLAYRLRGTTEQGMRWEVIQGLRVKNSERRNHGLRWLTNDIRIRHLCLEIFPKRVYTRMKSRNVTTMSTPNDNRSADSLKMVNEIPPLAFHSPLLNQRFTMVTILPTVATLLFNDQIETALAALNTDSVRISLGYPNLRVSVTDNNPSDDLVKRLIALGALLAERYQLLEKANHSDRSLHSVTV